MTSYINESNFFEGNNPELLAQKYGTPLYVYNERVLREHMRSVQGLVTKYPYTANFSVKANTNLTILKIALEEGMNCDAMSVGELRLLEMAGFPAERIFFVPNNVSDEELSYAIGKGIMTSLDSISQLRRFGRLNRGGRCAIRINPGVGAGHHEKVVTAGKNTKFGIEEHDIDEAIKAAGEYDLHIVGINQHVGSLFMDPEPYLKASQNFLRIAMKFKDLEFIDLGGGFGTPYHKLSGEQNFDMQALREALEPILDTFVKEYGSTPLFKSEPGRYITADGGVILGRVYALKNNGVKYYAGCDVGMNVLARPTLYDSHHDVEVIRNGQVVSPLDGTQVVNVVGNICESGDIIARDRELPILHEEDLVCVLDAGAYGYMMSYTYNMRGRAAEILCREDGSVLQIRRRETFEDLIRYFE